MSGLPLTTGPCAEAPEQGEPAVEGSARTRGRPHTLVVSDLHLTEAQPYDPRRPLWMRYKLREFFIDETFGRWLDAACREIVARGGAIADVELVLAGDIFDFDAVLRLPEQPTFPMTWLERIRGLDPEEPKSRWKAQVILRDHATWVDVVRRFVVAGGSLVFVIGNHDLELHWPAVQEEIVSALSLSAAQREAVRFVDWFYVTGDTLVEHGNQYDAYCVISDPIRPFIEKLGVRHLRLPFGNIAARLMVNGMGLFNPHVESSFLMSFRQYVVFFLRYMLRVQPLLLWTWLWSAMATLLRTLSEGLHAAVKDPTTFAARIDGIALRANSSASVALALSQLAVHPATFSPFKILRELWLDRALLVLGLLYVSFQLILVINAFVPVSLTWTFVPIALLLPTVIFYARTIQTDVYDAQKVAFEKIPIAAQIAGISRVVHGHTHRELHTFISGVEHLNAGTWSPAYRDPECTHQMGSKCFIWLEPSGDGASRRAGLYLWKDPGFELLTGQQGASRVDARLQSLSVPPPPPPPSRPPPTPEDAAAAI